MALYLSTLFLTYCLSLISTKVRKKSQFHYFLLIFTIIPLILLSGLREGVGTDYYTYRLIFDNISRQSALQLFASNEIGFSILTWICSKLIFDAQFMFLVIGAITIILMVTTLQKYSNRFELSMFLYFASLVYFVPFNIVRQGAAAAIVFYGTKYLLDNSKMRYFGIILIASTFHLSALIMLPMYFVVNKESRSKTIFLFSFFGVLSFLFFDSFWNGIFHGLSAMGFDRYVDSYWEITNGGVNIIRIFVSSIPPLIGLIFYDKLKSNNKKINYYINLSLVNFIVMLIAYNATYFARISIYFDMYNILLIPYFIRILNKNSRPIAYGIIVAVYFAYMLTQLTTQGNLIPYNTIL